MSNRRPLPPLLLSALWGAAVTALGAVLAVSAMSVHAVPAPSLDSAAVIGIVAAFGGLFGFVGGLWDRVVS